VIDQKLAIITIHDVAPPYLEKMLQISDELNKLKINYNLGIVPYYEKKYNIKDHASFCDQVSSLLQLGKVELILHGLYHQMNGKIEDFDTESKEDERKDIQQGLDILSAAKLPRPSTFIPPSWHLSRQAIEALKELNFNLSESQTDLDIIQRGKKYLIHPAMSWDREGDKEKNKKMLNQNKQLFYDRAFNVDGNSYGLFRMAIHPSYDPDEAQADQIEMIKYLKEKESYKFIKHSDILELESST
jgi:predicted deacetylase